MVAGTFQHSSTGQAALTQTKLRANVICLRVLAVCAVSVLDCFTPYLMLLGLLHPLCNHQGHQFLVRQPFDREAGWLCLIGLADTRVQYSVDLLLNRHLIDYPAQLFLGTASLAAVSFCGGGAIFVCGGVAGAWGRHSVVDAKARLNAVDRGGGGAGRTHIYHHSCVSVFVCTKYRQARPLHNNDKTQLCQLSLGPYQVCPQPEPAEACKLPAHCKHVNSHVWCVCVL